MKKNEAHEKIVQMIIERDGRCQWQHRIPRLGMLECWIVMHRDAERREPPVPELILLLAYDNGHGCEVFSNRDVPNKLTDIAAWLALGPGHDE